MRRVQVPFAAVLLAVFALAGCGTSTSDARPDDLPGRARGHGHPADQSGPPATAAGDRAGGRRAGGRGQQSPSDPVGDVNAHAPPLSQIRAQLKAELVAVKVSDASYIDPLRFVTHWERTDQGVDANMPVGAPILAPTQIKILAIEPDWYAGQPLVYWELLAGADAGKVQFVAEEITDIARPGSVLQQGQVIARYAPTGTGIEFGWSTPNGVTLAVATTGYEEGQVTPAGVSMRNWLNSLGANAGPS